MMSSTDNEPAFNHLAAQPPYLVSSYCTNTYLDPPLLTLLSPTPARGMQDFVMGQFNIVNEQT